jgi:hypothetical protein
MICPLGCPPKLHESAVLKKWINLEHRNTGIQEYRYIGKGDDAHGENIK